MIDHRSSEAAAYVSNPSSPGQELDFVDPAGAARDAASLAANVASPIVIPASWLSGFTNLYPPLNAAPHDPLTHPAFARVRAAMRARTELGERRRIG